MQLVIVLHLLFLIQRCFSFCYVAEDSIVRREVLINTNVTDQDSCEKMCTEKAECTAYSSSPEVITNCGILGSKIEENQCLPVTYVYKIFVKIECATTILPATTPSLTTTIEMTTTTSTTAGPTTITISCGDCSDSLIGPDSICPPGMKCENRQIEAYIGGLGSRKGCKSISAIAKSVWFRCDNGDWSEVVAVIQCFAGAGWRSGGINGIDLNGCVIAGEANN